MSIETKEITTGLENSTDFENDEQSLVETLLDMADYKNDENEVTEVEIKRHGKVALKFHIRPLDDDEIQECRRKATKYYQNPAGRKLPKIAGEIDDSKYKSLLIYTATIEEEKKRIWGQKVIKDKYNLMQNFETVGVILKSGEKTEISDIIFKKSGVGDENVSTPEFDEYVKN